MIGKKFDDLQVRSETLQILKQIVDWSAQHPAQSGGLQSVEGTAAQQIDQSLIDAIREPLPADDADPARWDRWRRVPMFMHVRCLKI
ncbi:hypothetical protein ACFQ1S_22020 [Kibdelosporangium lantanae]|uniref:Uncharacterized protein n=1 Tax=Kibdelosporangium lantanae TaxID=1497396 RepID=A0ABW3MBK3_9PSEU